MVAFNITDIKGFMSALFGSEAFDRFTLLEAEVRTFYTTKLNGRRHGEWYGEDASRGEDGEGSLGGDDGPPPQSEYLTWREGKPVVYSQIRGNRSPLLTKVVLRLGEEDKVDFLRDVDSPFSPEGVVGLNLTVHYEKGALNVISGVSLREFHPDKRLDQAWDGAVEKFLNERSFG